MSSPVETVTLWRLTGPDELALVEASGWRRWPPRLPGQPIFYPVLNEEYAAMIARDWNVKHSGVGYVTRFQVRRDFLDRYEVHQVGGQTILEYWIPAGDRDALNENMVGPIDVVAEGGWVLREINRRYYHGNDYEYPIALGRLPDGREVLVHCPDHYNKLEIEELSSGRRLTERPGRAPDVFHSRLSLSPGGRRLLSGGLGW